MEKGGKNENSRVDVPESILIVLMFLSAPDKKG